MKKNKNKEKIVCNQSLTYYIIFNKILSTLRVIDFFLKALHQKDEGKLLENILFQVIQFFSE